MQYNMIEIYVSEFYNRPEFYPFMPSNIFAALEQAFADDNETARVSVSDYDKMMTDYKNAKIKGYESNNTHADNIINPTAVF